GVIRVLTPHKAVQRGCDRNEVVLRDGEANQTNRLHDPGRTPPAPDAGSVSDSRRAERHPLLSPVILQFRSLFRRTAECRAETKAVASGSANVRTKRTF